MIKEVLAGMHTFAFAEVALVLFVTVFVSVLLRVLLLRAEDARAHASLPLENETVSNESQEN